MQENNCLSVVQTDTDLMLSLQKGNDTALNAIMMRYKNKLFHFASRYTQDDEEAYDIVQEAFIKVYKRAETYNPEYGFKTWLYQITLNLCRDNNRKKKWKNIVSLNFTNNDEEAYDIETVFASDENVESIVGYRQELKMVGQHILSLPHKLKSALILYVIEGYSQEECAKILNVSVKTVETRIYRARKILSEKLL